jgi:tricarboxylate carrier
MLAVSARIAMRHSQTQTFLAVRGFSAIARAANAGGKGSKFRSGFALASAAGFAYTGLEVVRMDGASSSGVPVFSMDKSRYDQSTFMGRLMGMYDVIDPRTLLLTSADLKKSQELLEQFKTTGTKPAGVSDAEMWTHRKNVEVSIHPVTGEELLKVGRMSAFVPMNVPLCAIMLMASSPTQVVLTQWLNQTYNVVNNYVNRSGATVDWSSLLQSYGLAVSASCGIALGAKQLIAAIPALSAAGPFVPYLAVISAGSANVAFTRMEEWRGKGVSVCDAEGKELGMSVKAGQQGVLQTVVTRSCFLPVAPMVLPILGMKLINPPAGAAAVVVELVLITACISGMLPVALSILPTTMEMNVNSLEPEFQNLKDSQGKPITTVYANKGL